MPIEPGQQLLHYRLIEKIGEGGMGVVYRGFCTKLRRDVALKVLRDDFPAGTDHRARLLAEARAASPLNHPGIATIYEVVEHDGVLVIVMEYVEGVTLRRHMDTPISASEHLNVAVQIADALDAAHRGSVVHGDVKPDNTLIQSDGTVKLLDFGVARSFATDTLTATITAEDVRFDPRASIAGTLAYMAPERLEGAPIDPRSDLFSLGVMLYEMGVGRRPFPGPDASSLVRQIVEDPTPRIDPATTTLPPDWTRVVHKLLEKDPDRRYQSARDVRVDLANLQRDLELGPTLSSAGGNRRTVAVLPFHLLVPRREDEYLSLALADSIVNALGASPQLLLRPSSAVQRYASERVDPLIAARELNVDVVVEGNVHKLGPQMRVHVQVWNADDGSTLLSTKFDGEVNDLFALQDRISDGLFDVLGVETTEVEPAQPTTNPHAYELFLRAVERLSYGNRWDTRTAIEMLRSVVDLDPEFTEAWARLALACVQMGFSFEPGGAWCDLAEEAVERALALDPNNVLARVGRGRVLWSPDRGFRNRPALEALGEAVRINPQSHQAIVWRSLIFLHVGLLEEGLAGLKEALTIQPDDPFTLNFIGQVYEFLGDFEQAGAYQAMSLARDPTHQFALLFVPSSLVQLGKLDEAERQLGNARAVLGEDKMLAATEAILWARRGDRSRAEECLTFAERHESTVAHTHHAWHHIGAAHALLDRRDESVEWLEKAAGSGLPNYPLFRDDPQLAGLHGHPRFESLMQRLKTECDAYRREFVG